ncbi:MAG: ABC transporter ATP-binding protein [Phycisphaerae bacterium]
MACVNLVDVTKDYPGGVRAVNRVTLAIDDQELVVLVGPSGCGKSTTLRMIAGLEAITSGTIRIGDRVVNDVPPKDRDIAMVFQNYALYPHMTVYKNMAFSLKLRRRALGLKKADIDKKIRETAALLGVADLLDRRPGALSGGQRQRVAVGRAIVRSPKVFLFDEPLSNLDAKMRLEMRAEIKRLQRRLKTTTVYVTHDQEEAMTLGDRVVVMKDGIIHQCASAMDVYARPVNRFVASFIGTPPMNFLDGRLARGDGGLRFERAGASLPLAGRMADRLSAYSDREMVLGVRPDAFSAARPTAAEGTAAELGVRISLVEPLGDRQDVYMTLADGTGLVGRVDAHGRFREGQELAMFVDMDRVHVFEPGESGLNVTAARRDGAVAGAN